MSSKGKEPGKGRSPFFSSTRKSKSPIPLEPSPSKDNSVKIAALTDHDKIAHVPANAAAEAVLANAKKQRKTVVKAKTVAAVNRPRPSDAKKHKNVAAVAHPVPSDDNATTLAAVDNSDLSEAATTHTPAVVHNPDLPEGKTKTRAAANVSGPPKARKAKSVGLVSDVKARPLTANSSGPTDVRAKSPATSGAKKAKIVAAVAKSEPSDVNVKTPTAVDSEVTSSTGKSAPKKSKPEPKNLNKLFKKYGDREIPAKANKNLPKLMSAPAVVAAPVDGAPNATPSADDTDEALRPDVVEAAELDEPDRPASVAAIDNDTRDKAAVKIQAAYRGQRERREFLTTRQKAIKVQAVIRGHLTRTHIVASDETASRANVELESQEVERPAVQKESEVELDPLKQTESETPKEGGVEE